MEADKLWFEPIQLMCHLQRPELRAVVVLCASVGHTSGDNRRVQTTVVEYNPKVPNGDWLA